AKLFAIERKFDFAFGDLLKRVAVTFKVECTAVPDHHGAGAVVTLRDFAFEAAVREGMIFGLNGEALVCVIERRPFRDSPGFERSVDRKTEVVMKARCAMLLDHKSISVLRIVTMLEIQLRHRQTSATGFWGKARLF